MTQPQPAAAEGIWVPLDIAHELNRELIATAVAGRRGTPGYDAAQWLATTLHEFHQGRLARADAGQGVRISRDDLSKALRAVKFDKPVFGDWDAFFAWQERLDAALADTGEEVMPDPDQ